MPGRPTVFYFVPPIFPLVQQNERKLLIGGKTISGRLHFVPSAFPLLQKLEGIYDWWKLIPWLTGFGVIVIIQGRPVLIA